MKLSSYQKGVSIIEIIMVLAVVVILIAIITPSLTSFRKNQSIQNTTNSIVSLVQEARTKTLASYNNTFYSVYFNSDNAVLFTGGTYSPTEITNKVVTYESPVVLQSGTSLNGGGSKISFDRLKGTTSQYGTIVVGISGGASKTITVSSSGIISRN